MYVDDALEHPWSIQRDVQQVDYYYVAFFVSVVFLDRPKVHPSPRRRNEELRLFYRFYRVVVFRSSGFYLLDDPFFLDNLEILAPSFKRNIYYSCKFRVIVRKDLPEKKKKYQIWKRLRYFHVVHCRWRGRRNFWIGLFRRFRSHFFEVFLTNYINGFVTSNRWGGTILRGRECILLFTVQIDDVLTNKFQTYSLTILHP